MDIFFQFRIHHANDALVMESRNEIRKIQVDDWVFVKVLFKRGVFGNFQVGKQVARVARLVLVGA